MASSTAPACVVSSLLSRGAAHLREAGIEDASREAALLLGRVLGMEPWRVLLEPDRPAGAGSVRELEALVGRRVAGEPIAYILGEREFYGRAFSVGPEVLIPRPETEGLVEAALARRPSPGGLVVDLGTGSGCLAVTLALEMPQARIVATDPSRAALRVARANAGRHGVQERLDLRCGAGWQPVLDLAGRIEVALSNPPYVSEGEWSELEPQVGRWEPRDALVAGPSGLEVLREIAGAAGDLLAPGGRLLLEVGAGQAPTVRSWFGEGWSTAVLADLAGIERVVVATVDGES